MISNPQKDAIPSDLSLDEFAHAMARLDLSGVAPENRGKAVMDHLIRVMIGSIHDPQTKYDLAAAQIARRRR